jgi:hypothetical protein
MMPVRRLETSAVEGRMGEDGGEHGRHAIEAGAALGGHGGDHRGGVEGLGRQDDGGAMGQAAQDAHRHAEAVVERHRQAQAVADGPKAMPAQTFSPLLRMLWWLSVAPLGEPVVPLVNWMLMASSNCSGGDLRSAASGLVARPGRPHRRRPRSRARFRRPWDHDLQGGQARALDSLPGAAVANSGASVLSMPR